jgi:hypothetical protein
MKEVVECGADEGSVEHYIATKFFGKLEIELSSIP